MTTLWRRMQQDPQNYRKIQKSLVLLEYLLYNGSDRVIQEAKANVYQIRQLRNFHFTDETGKEVGSSIRETSKKIVKLLKDEEALKEERKKQKKLNGRFQGMSGEDIAYGGFGSSGGGFGSGSGGYGSGYGSGSGSGFGSGYGDNSNRSDSDDETPKKKKKNNSDSDSDFNKTSSPKYSDDEPTITRPRRNSNIRVNTRKEAPIVDSPQQTVIQSPQPVQQKQEKILNMDELFFQESAPQPVSINQSGFVDSPQDQWETNFENSNPFEEVKSKPKNDLDGAFDDDFGEGDFVSGNEEEKNTLFNISKGLVDLSLSNKPKEEQNLSGPRKTLNQIKNEKAGVLSPNTTNTLKPVLTNNRPITTQQGFPQPYGAPQAFPSPYPGQGFPQQPYGVPQPYGNVPPGFQGPRPMGGPIPMSGPIMGGPVPMNGPMNGQMNGQMRGPFPMNPQFQQNQLNRGPQQPFYR